VGDFGGRSCGGQSSPVSSLCKRQYLVTDPVVIVEVVSPSTMDLDRGHKLQCYEELPTVQHIVLAYADRKRVEHHRRTESGWERKVLSTSESVVVLDAVEFRIDLARIYFDVLLFGMQFLALTQI
jgi:Uma2 family endonuclease